MDFIAPLAEHLARHRPFRRSPAASMVCRMEGSGPALGLSPRLDTRPGLQLLSFLALLPASVAELDAAIDRAVANNPLLERASWHPCPTCGLATVADRCAACGTARWDLEPEAAVDWRAELLRDAAVELPAALHPVLELVVASIDDHGLMPVAPDAPADSVALVVEGLRAVGPPGIAAYSRLDCVRAQAASLVAEGEVPPLVRQIADDWLAEVAEERFADVAAATGTTEVAVREAVDALRTRTRPYVALAGGAARSAPTDVVFTQPEPGGALVAHVADASATGLLVVSDISVQTPEARAWVSPHREAAQRLMAAVAARGHMLKRVAGELAIRQHGFIVDGTRGHVPLSRHDVATALGVHPSTVGRAVTGKVARCPDGRQVPLAMFFGGTTSTLVSVATALENHPGANDRELAEQLSRAGVPIARRTVAKYRALIANSASPIR
jgi:RNA polymerase sigma-54 factor